MRYTELGKTGMQISHLSFGASSLGSVFRDTNLKESCEAVEAAIEGGVEIKTLNVGSMAHSQGKFAVNKVLSLDAKDIETFEKLKEHGVEFDVRKVPSDSKENMDTLLQKAREGLGI